MLFIAYVGVILFIISSFGVYMEVLFLVIQIILAVLLVGIVLLQRSDSDGASALSGGGGNVMGGVMSHKSASSFLVKVTAILMAAFFVNSLLLGNLAQRKAHPVSLLTTEKQAHKHKQVTHEGVAQPEYPSDMPSATPESKGE